MGTDETHQTAGRKANAATTLDNETPTAVTPERYPAADKHDSVEPLPRLGAGDGGPRTDKAAGR